MNDDNSLIASGFKKDPRVIQAKRLFNEAIQSCQAQIFSVQPPRCEFKESYEKMLEDFNQIRGGKLYFPYLGSGIGRGPLVELLDGSIKYDMITGIGPHFWGHSYPPLMEAALDAALSDTPMQGHLLQNQEAFLLSELLVKSSGLDHCFLSSSGAMANENALKIAFQKKFPAYRILAFEKCFMGRTLSLAQITDKPGYREGLPTSLAIDYIPFFQSEDPEGSTKRAVQILHQYLDRYPRLHAVMCFELIQGEAGFNAGTTLFFSSLMDVLKEHEIPIFIDEIQTFGRTPQLFAFQHFQLEKYVDIVSIGKLSQVCATLFRTTLKPKSGLLSQTFTSSTVAIQTSYWIVQHLLSDQFFGNEGKLVKLHDRFEAHFKQLEKQFPENIKGPYGIGGMVIFTPLDGSFEKVARFVQNLFHAGVISFTAGSHPTRVRFLIPAGVMTFEDVDAVMQIVEQVLIQELNTKS